MVPMPMAQTMAGPTEADPNEGWLPRPTLDRKRAKWHSKTREENVHSETQQCVLDGSAVCVTFVFT